MSEREFVTDLQAVMPTFQVIFNNRIPKIMDALDEGQYLYALKCMRTLIMALNPQHSKSLLENDVKHIDEQVDEINQLSDVDCETTRIKRRHSARNLAPSIIELYRKVMETLHKHGYLEKTRTIPKSRFKE